VTLALLFVAGLTMRVHLQAGNWLQMTLLMLVGLAPFAAIGILLGHLLTADSIGPAIGGVTAVFALLGGVWFPVSHGAMHELAEALPSYWLVQASHVGLGGSGWGATGWFVIAAWTVVAATAARRAYARDTQRV
jgi:ABC-2 type transport system permease protein